ncbi:MAG: biotin/lipoyl-binding protein [Pedosphaera sp.]|nr:biotin/lipoyl-binding protein [Pedosphaera sp.]
MASLTTKLLYLPFGSFMIANVEAARQTVLDFAARAVAPKGCMQQLRRFNLVTVCVMILFLTACRRGAATSPKDSRAEATSVTVASVTNAAWDKTVSIVGTLYPKDEATVAAQVEGQVEKTLVEFGDRVRADQDLALIDTASYEAQLEQTSGNLAKAEASLANAR